MIYIRTTLSPIALYYGKLDQSQELYINVQD